MLAQTQFNNNFHFLRLFAALCITFTHSFALLGLQKQEWLMILTKNKIDFSFIGLCIFFSISGYLITQSAIASSSFINYLWKRFLRIQPLLIVVCFLSVFIVGPFFSVLLLQDYFTNTHTFSYFRNIMPIFGIQYHLPGVFTTNIGEASVNGSMWTLVVEERLYVIVGLLFVLKNKMQKFYVILILLLNAIYFMHTVFFNSNLWHYLNGGHVFYSLIFLNASYFYLHNFNFKNKSYAILCLIPILLFLVQKFKISESIQVLIIPFFVIAIANIKAFTNDIHKYGDYTYGIYIFSFPIQQIIISLNLANTAVQLFFLTLLAVIPLSILSWHFIEKKMLRLKNIIL